MNTWKLTYNKFIPEEERLRESLCTLGNGYFGTRGAAPETGVSRVHYPGTYIAGVYNTLPTDVAGRTVNNEDFVNCPNWLLLNYRIDDGPWYERLKVKILTWKLELNMRKGMLSRRVRWQDDKGRITLVENHRIVSMANPHLGTIRCTITPENYSGKITVRSGIDGQVINAGVDRYKQLSSKHLMPLKHGHFQDNGIYLQMQTTQSKIQITQAQTTFVYDEEEKAPVKLNVISHGRERIIHEFVLDAKKGKKYGVDKIVSIYTSRDQGVADNCQMAQEAVSSIKSFEDIYKPHYAKWKALWRRFDVEIKGDEFVQKALRLHTFHLLQSASTYNEDIDAGMPVRGLHGEAYRGHIFWDELFVFPFYNLHAPEITRALLMYRYRRLAAAKENAKSQGFKGAMYPWQTASLGDEQSQSIHLNPLSNTWGPDYSLLQRHVSIAVAYNVWTYCYSSGDKDFLNRYGAEMILEIAQFWSSKAKLNQKTKRYEIHGVMGPDEFHEKYPASNQGGINNNAYTNVLAVWVISKALYILETLLIDEEREALLFKTGITIDDLKKWKDITTKMFVPIDKNSFIHQFEGYMDLEELDWEEYREKYENIHRIDRILKAEGLSPDSYKVAKQADVLMIFYLLNSKEVQEILETLGYVYKKDILKINFDYYLPRTSHGSTLSKVVHGHIAELFQDRRRAMAYFTDALKSDIYDTQGGTTQEGIHAGVMGGTMDVFLKMFAGLSLCEDRIYLDPKLPKGWESIKFHVRYKNVWFDVFIDQNGLTVTAVPLKGMTVLPATKISIEVKNKTYHLIPNEPYQIKI